MSQFWLDQVRAQKLEVDEGQILQQDNAIIHGTSQNDYSVDGGLIILSKLKINFFDSRPREELRPNLKSIMNLKAHATYAAIDAN